MKISKILIISFITLFLLKSSPALSQQRSICTANLTAQSKNDRITLRSKGGTNYKSKGYGLVGDFVYILSTFPPEAEYTTDSQGYLWYHVQFQKNRAIGWIRQDFLRMKCAYD